MIVELLQDEPRFGLKKGWLYNAKVYGLDPSKVTILNRVKKKDHSPFKKEIYVNEYRKNIKIIS